MSSPYRSPKTFKLKPYQSKARGRERVTTGVLLLAFALFNLYMIQLDGVISLIFAVFFGWSGLKNLALGLRLTQLPERDRAYRISIHGLFKVLEGRELARLDLSQIKAIWMNLDQSKLSLMTHKGVETIERAELEDETEWDEFTTWVERSVTETIFRDDPRLWEAVQKQSLAMSQLGERKLVGSMMLIMATLVGAAVFFYTFWQHIPFFIQAEKSELILYNLGAPSGVTLLLGELYRVFAGMMIPGPGLSLVFNLFVLFWVGRSLEQIWGTWRVLAIYFSGYMMGLLTVCYLDPHTLYVGSQGGSLALCAAAYVFQNGGPKPRVLSTTPQILKKASSSAFILGLIFLISQGFERNPTSATQTSWLVSVFVGLCLGAVFGQKSRQKQAWVLSDGDRYSATLSVLGSAIPVGSLVFAMLHISSPPQISSSKQLNRYTPIALIELAQRCSGAPIDEVSSLQEEVIEALPKPTRCTEDELALISNRLNKLVGFYPWLPTHKSNESNRIAHPPSVMAQTIHRTLALLWFDQLPTDRLKKALFKRALWHPQDLFGDLLVSIESVLAAKSVSELNKQGNSEVTVESEKGRLTLKLERGQLRWDWLVTDRVNKDTDQKTTDLVWLRVLDADQIVKKLIVMSLPSQFNPKLHPARTRVRDLGFQSQNHSIEVIAQSSYETDFPSLLGERVRSYAWNPHPRLNQWVSDRLLKK